MALLIATPPVALPKLPVGITISAGGIAATLKIHLLIPHRRNKFFFKKTDMAPPSPLAIATSALLRLIKEEASYHKELLQQAERIRKLEAQPKSEENVEYMLRQEVFTVPTSPTERFFPFLAGLIYIYTYACVETGSRRDESGVPSVERAD